MRRGSLIANSAASGLFGIITVVITLVLLTYASLMMLNAKSSLESAKRMSDRNAAFYEIDADAQRFLLYLDNNLTAAVEFADTYILTKSYRDRFYTGQGAAPGFSELHGYLYKQYEEQNAQSDFDLAAFEMSARNYCYLFHAKENIWDNQESLFRSLSSVSEISLSPFAVDSSVSDCVLTDLKAGAIFYGETSENLHLTVETDVYPLTSPDFAEKFGITEWRLR